MSKRKGLSLEEKREKVLEVFTQSADVFVLKVCTVCAQQCSSTSKQSMVMRLRSSPAVTTATGAISGRHVEALMLPRSGCREAGLQEGGGAANHQGGVASK